MQAIPIIERNAAETHLDQLEGRYRGLLEAAPDAIAISESGTEVTHDPLPEVIADKRQLMQLFQNIVGNAIKYQSGSAPTVHVAATMNGSSKWVFLRERQRPRHRSAIFRPDFRDVPAAAQARRIRGHRHWPRHLQEDCRAAWWNNFGGIGAGRWLHFQLRAACGLRRLT